jgi:hypothetical protein
MAQSNSWGVFPEIAVTQGCGLLFLAAVNTAGRFALPWALDIFYIALIILYLPAFIRLLMENVSRRERIALVVMTAVTLFMVKTLHSPASFTLHDELLHWKTVDTIMIKDHLFTENPLLPVSPLYPGLHLTTVSLAEILGISIYSAGSLMIGMIRIVLAVSLFLLLEYASQSSRVAGLGTLLYMGNSNFIFFMSQFAYESLSLPLGLLLLVLVSRRHKLTGLSRLTANVCVLAFSVSIVATHHLTAYMMIAFLSMSVPIFYLWPRLEPILRAIVNWSTRRFFYRWFLRFFVPPLENPNDYRRVQPSQLYFWTALLVAVASLAWMLYVATPTLGYLTPVFSEAFNELLSIIRQENTSRQLFASEGGNVRPLWERLTALGSVVLAIAALPFGLTEIWRRYRDRTVALILTLAGGAYFITLGFRFTEKGWELSNRSSEFLFIGVGFIIALAMLAWMRQRRFVFIWYPLFSFCGVILFIGGMLAGWAYWARIPGPYMVGADTRSVERQGLLAAGWTEQYLQHDSRIIVDRINGLLMGSYGRQYTLRSLTDVQSAPVLFSLSLGEWEYQIIRETRADYVVTDYRLTTELPELGVFVEVGEPGGNKHVEPLSPVAMEKFDNVAGVSRIFDSGNIMIYDVKAISDEPLR